jgi:hypothetical protein
MTNPITQQQALVPISTVRTHAAGPALRPLRAARGATDSGQLPQQGLDRVRLLRDARHPAATAQQPVATVESAGLTDTPLTRTAVRLTYGQFGQDHSAPADTGRLIDLRV